MFCMYLHFCFCILAHQLAMFSIWYRCPILSFTVQRI